MFVSGIPHQDKFPKMCLGYLEVLEEYWGEKRKKESTQIVPVKAGRKENEGRPPHKITYTDE